MNRVPTEIWNQIFIKLTLKNRLKCMLVCRSWYRTVNRFSLLYDLHITDRQYNKLKDIIKLLPYRGAQTEYLSIYDKTRPNFDKRELCNMFPNLRELRLSTLYYLDFEDHLSRPFHLTNPASKLERILDYGECELTRQLIMSNLCNTLKSLDLNLRHFNSSFITQLESMPVLEHLGLIGPNIRLIDLEIMHNNLPTLKSLYLQVNVISGEVPHGVIPATLITKVKTIICSADDLNTHIQFYKYLANKYPSVNKPNFGDSVIVNEGMTYVREVYNEGILPFYQNIGPRIDTFSFSNYCAELDAFRKFDAFGMKLKELEVDTRYHDAVFSLGELAQSQQSKSIQKLIFNDIIPAPLEMMNNMEALTRLEIIAKYFDYDQDDEPTRTIDFCQLVGACPKTLLYLKISGLYFTFNEATSNQTCIECLNLSYMPLDHQLAKIIETSFPKLNQLLYEGEMRNDVTISLPKHNLDLVFITIYYNEIGPNGFVITTTSDDQVEYYGKRKFDAYDGNGQLHTYNNVVSVPREEFDDRPVLRLTCGSVDQLFLCTDPI